MKNLLLILFLFLSFTSLTLYGADDISEISSFQKEDLPPTPELMGFFNNPSMTTAVLWLFKTGSRPQVSSSISHLPSPAVAGVPTVYSFRPIASLQPVGRISMRDTRRAFSTIPPTQDNAASSDSVSSIQGVQKVENATAISAESEKANFSFAYNRWRKASKAGEVARAAAVFAINSTSAETIRFNKEEWGDIDISISPFLDYHHDGGLIFTHTPSIFDIYSTEVESIKFNEEAWNKASEAAKAVEEAHSEAIETHQKGLNSSAEANKNVWRNNLDIIEKQRDFWASEFLMIKAHKEDAMAHAVIFESQNTSYQEAEKETWVKAKTAVKTAMEAYSQIIDFCKLLSEIFIPRYRVAANLIPGYSVPINFHNYGFSDNPRDAELIEYPTNLQRSNLSLVERKQASLIADLFSSRILKAEQSLHAALGNIESMNSKANEEAWVEAITAVQTAVDNYYKITDDCDNLLSSSTEAINKSILSAYAASSSSYAFNFCALSPSCPSLASATLETNSHKVMDDVTKTEEVYWDNVYRVFGYDKSRLVFNISNPLVIKAFQVRENMKVPFYMFLFKFAYADEMKKNRQRDTWNVQNLPDNSWWPQEVNCNKCTFEINKVLKGGRRINWKEHYIKEKPTEREQVNLSTNVPSSSSVATSIQVDYQQEIWDQRTEKAQIAEEAYARIADFCRKRIALSINDGDQSYWGTCLKNAENNQNVLNANFWIIKSFQAEEATAVVDAAFLKAQQYSPETAEKSWNEVLENAQVTEEVYSQTIDMIRKVEDYEACRDELLKFFESKKVNWTCDFLAIQAFQKEAAVASSVSKAQASPLRIDEEDWNQAIDAAKAVELAYVQAVDFCEGAINGNIEFDKTYLVKRFKELQYNKIFWTAKPFEIKAKRAEKSIKVALEQSDIKLLSKLADADEVQGVDGAQELSVQKLLDAPRTGATSQFAASVELREKFVFDYLLWSQAINEAKLALNTLSQETVEYVKIMDKVDRHKRWRYNLESKNIGWISRLFHQEVLGKTAFALSAVPPKNSEAFKQIYEEAYSQSAIDYIKIIENAGMSKRYDFNFKSSDYDVIRKRFSKIGDGKLKFSNLETPPNIAEVFTKILHEAVKATKES